MFVIVHYSVLVLLVFHKTLPRSQMTERHAHDLEFLDAIASLVPQPSPQFTKVTDLKDFTDCINCTDFTDFTDCADFTDCTDFTDFTDCTD